eukprot:jgi/Phyca11/106426/e_gw1.12.667.1
MLDEARIVLVSSWLDLISRAVFGLGIIITTASMKQLLRWKPIKIDSRGPSTAEHVLFRSVHFLFFAWGIVILTLHTRATQQDPLLECSPKVYPMAGFLPACFAVEFDCYRMKISGGREE